MEVTARLLNDWLEASGFILRPCDLKQCSNRDTAAIRALSDHLREWHTKKPQTPIKSYIPDKSESSDD